MRLLLLNNHIPNNTLFLSFKKRGERKRGREGRRKGMKERRKEGRKEGRKGKSYKNKTYTNWMQGKIKLSKI
jgi:hypothetical protein